MAFLRNFALLGALFAAAAAHCGCENDTESSAPVVDLGYAIYQAQVSTVSDPFSCSTMYLIRLQSYQSNSYYNFSNIRYAAPPVGKLRFNAPALPLENRTAGVQDGLYGNICPQAIPSWILGARALNPGASNENEDCLFLDVVVPKSVYDSKTSAPVVLWIHGGGYSLGSKYSAGNPMGLLDQGLDTVSGGQIWVGINYRVSTFES